MSNKNKVDPTGEYVELTNDHDTLVTSKPKDGGGEVESKHDKTRFHSVDNTPNLMAALEKEPDTLSVEDLESVAFPDKQVGEIKRPKSTLSPRQDPRESTINLMSSKSGTTHLRSEEKTKRQNSRRQNNSGGGVEDEDRITPVPSATQIGTLADEANDSADNDFQRNRSTHKLISKSQHDLEGATHLKIEEHKDSQELEQLVHDLYSSKPGSQGGRRINKAFLRNPLQESLTIFPSKNTTAHTRNLSHSSYQTEQVQMPTIIEVEGLLANAGTAMCEFCCSDQGERSIIEHQISLQQDGSDRFDFEVTLNQLDTAVAQPKVLSICNFEYTQCFLFPKFKGCGKYFCNAHGVIPNLQMLTPFTEMSKLDRFTYKILKKPDPYKVMTAPQLPYQKQQLELMNLVSKYQFRGFHEVEWAKTVKFCSDCEPKFREAIAGRRIMDVPFAQWVGGIILGLLLLILLLIIVGSGGSSEVTDCGDYFYWETSSESCKQDSCDSSTFLDLSGYCSSSCSLDDYYGDPLSRKCLHQKDLCKGDSSSFFNSTTQSCQKQAEANQPANTTIDAGSNNGTTNSTGLNSTEGGNSSSSSGNGTDDPGAGESNQTAESNTTASNTTTAGGDQGNLTNGTVSDSNSSTETNSTSEGGSSSNETVIGEESVEGNTTNTTNATYEIPVTPADNSTTKENSTEVTAHTDPSPGNSSEASGNSTTLPANVTEPAKPIDPAENSTVVPGDNSNSSSLTPNGSLPEPPQNSSSEPSSNETSNSSDSSTAAPDETEPPSVDPNPTNGTDSSSPSVPDTPKLPPDDLSTANETGSNLNETEAASDNSTGGDQASPDSPVANETAPSDDTSDELPSTPDAEASNSTDSTAEPSDPEESNSTSTLTEPSDPAPPEQHAFAFQNQSDFSSLPSINDCQGEFLSKGIQIANQFESLQKFSTWSEACKTKSNFFIFKIAIASFFDESTPPAEMMAPSGYRYIYYDELANNNGLKQSVFSNLAEQNSTGEVGLINGWTDGENIFPLCGNTADSRSFEFTMIIDECYPIGE